MSTASSQSALRLVDAPAVISGEKALRSAAFLWFVVTVIGQWVFLYYIVAFYGASTLSADFQAWNTNPFLRKGYVPGDIPEKVSASAFHVFDFASYLLPLAVLEFYLRAKDSGGSRARYSTAGALFICTAYMGLGTFAFYMFVTQKILA